MQNETGARNTSDSSAAAGRTQIPGARYTCIIHIILYLGIGIIYISRYIARYNVNVVEVRGGHTRKDANSSRLFLFLHTCVYVLSEQIMHPLVKTTYLLLKRIINIYIYKYNL